jgi:hypothetical protein
MPQWLSTLCNKSPGSLAERDPGTWTYVRPVPGLGLRQPGEDRGQAAGRGVDSGNGVLCTLHDPEADPMINAFILGTFKGKLNDWDGDGVIDLNSRDVYSTVDGDIDSDQDGIVDQPGLTCCDYLHLLP